jgi:hypothetical protein
MAPNAYPLVTRKQILAELASDPDFVAECMGVVHGLYLARRRGEIEHGGWMASQASEGTRLAKKFADGEQSDADVVRAVALLRRYSRALAAHFRGRQLVEQPELIEVAALFGVAPGPTVPVGPRGSPAAACSEPAAATPDADVLGSAAPAAPARGAPVAPTPAEPEQEPSPAESATSGGPSRPRGLDSRVLAFVTKYPGSRAEVIARELRVETSEVSAALRRLLDDGRIRREGVARGTTYYPASK